MIIDKISRYLANKPLIRAKLLLYILLALLVAHPSPSSAQSVFDLSITPPVAFLRVRPGTSATHIVTLENTGQTALTLKPKFVDFIPDQGKAIPQAELTFSYLDLPTQGFAAVTLPPGRKSQLSIKVTPPRDAIEKEYYLTILFESVLPQNETAAIPNPNNSTNVLPSIGSNLIVLVSQTDQDTNLSITEFGIGPIVDSFRPINFSPSITNQSIQATSASGSAKLINWHGDSIYEQNIMPMVVLGQETRKLYGANLDETSTNPDGILTPIEFIFTPKFLLGPYQLEIELINPDLSTQKFQQAFFALPISVLFIGLIFGLTQLAWYLLKRRT
jgi:hypothetical protein